MSARSRAIEELYQMRCLAAFCKNLKECLEYARSAEPPEPLPYAVPVAKFRGQCSPGNAVDCEIVDCLQEFTVVMPRLSPARLHRVEHFKCDQPISLRHSRKHARLPDAGHAVIRLISDSGTVRNACQGFRPHNLVARNILRSWADRCRPRTSSDSYTKKV